MILVTGCFFESVTSIRVVSGIKASWELDEEVDLHSIVIEVVIDGKVTKTVYGDTDGVSIVGLDTTASGQKTAVVTYEGVSVNVSYLVVGEDSTASNIATLKTLLEQGQEIITLTEGTYDFNITTQIKITKSVVLRAVPETQVVLKNVYVEFDADNQQAGIVEFRNVEFGSGKNKFNLQVVTQRGVQYNTPINELDRVVLNNVTVSTTGAIDGIKLDGKTHFEMYQSEWKTPTQDDYFKHMVTASTSKLKNVLLVFENNEFKCNFWYGLYEISQAIVKGNLFEGTIPVDSHLRDTAYAPVYNVNKNPVIFHANLRTSEEKAGQFNMVVENNTFKNAENLFRVYQTDHNTTVAIEDDLIFTNNLVTNVNYLVNYSTNAYTKNVLAVVEAGLKTGSQYLNGSRAVLAQNTAISGTYGPDALLKVGEDMIYRGFTYQEKDTSDAANRYYYIGTINGSKTLARFVGEEVHYYTITLAYSADGLDTRNIVRITDATTVSILENYRSLGNFTIQPFAE